jgi:glycine betaine/proline transport system permease protein
MDSRNSINSPTIFNITTKVFWLAAVLIVLAGWIASSTIPAFKEFPEEWIFPLKDYIDRFFEWIVYEVKFFVGTFAEFKPTDITRGFVAVMKFPLEFTESLFFNGFGKILPPLPWITVVALAFLLGYWIAGLRTSLIAGFSFLYLALFGVWKASMETFALVIITVPFVFSLGVILGIWISKSARVERFWTPVFSIMQSMPPFAYFVPIVVLYGVGDAPAMIATAVFAVPPVARSVFLGLKSVPNDVIEAGLMMGVTPRQLLWRVQLPTARNTILVGLNQGIMMTLAMIVLASLIGASGLGSKLLTSLQGLKIGQAIEQGIAIVVIAVALDQLSQAYANKPPVYKDRTLPWIKQHPYLSIAGAILLVTFIIAYFVPEAQVLPRKLTITTRKFWNGSVEWIDDTLYDTVQPFRNFMLLKILIPVRDFCRAIPWPTLVLLVGLLGYRFGGYKIAISGALMILFPAIMGLWTPTMTTVYMVSLSTCICVVSGFLIGLLSAKNKLLGKISIGFCNFFQTFPSFIYLIPVLMLFKVSDLSAILAMLLFAVTPMIRYTILGLNNVSSNIIESSRQMGTTSWQRLLKVELPIALPEIMLGINQVIFYSLFMVAIASLIGTQDLGAVINGARSGNKVGQALIAGFCIAFLGIASDRIIMAWTKLKKDKLGIRE